MESAYLYVRVSTDEQKRKGYSLPEQEDRLLKYCEYNNIKVKGICREDFSAKSFNRPEWKKLIAVIKQNSAKETNNILFVKWDRFSRNIEYAYEMIGILRKYNTTAIAIDQPVDFEVPESSVMLAVYLAIPEAENGRRSLNSKNGIRRAKQLGRYPNKAPIGYINRTAPDGKKYIAPHWPEADLIKWSFQQLAKHAYRIEDVRKMAINRGLKCSRSNFWKLLHNPVYCGYVSFSSIEFEEPQLVKGIHEPIVTEKLFFDVQNIIDTKRKIVRRNHETNEMFILHRYLTCTNCNCKLCGSFSTGRSKKYPYYHCKAICKTRFRADNINSDYVERLKKIKLSKGALQLFELILKDTNANTLLDECLNERASILKQLREQECLIDKSRKLFLNDKIEFDDFSKLKKEYLVLKKDLTDQLEKSTRKLNSINKQLDSIVSFKTIFSGFSDLNLNDKKQIIHFISPGRIDVYGNFILHINNSLAKILSMKSNNGFDISAIADTQALLPANHNFKDRKVSIRKAINILAQNNIDTNENDADVILDFLYLIAKSSKLKDKTVPVMVKEKSNRQNLGQHQF